MVDEISDRLNDSLEEVFGGVLEGRIEKNRYRVEAEILTGPWEKDIVIERLQEQGKL